MGFAEQGEKFGIGDAGPSLFMGHYAKFARTAKPTKDLVPACFSGPDCRCWPMLGNIIAGGEIIGNLAGGGRRYFLKDHLGSVRTTVDRNGNIVGRDDYYPFGLAMPGRSSNSSNPNDDYKFTGYELDNEARLDLYHANARGYDPVLGRFLQIDRFYHKYPGISSYAYVLNNPVGLTDVTGDTVDIDDRLLQEARKRTGEQKVLVDMTDIEKSAYYFQKWYHEGGGQEQLSAFDIGGKF